MMRPQTETRSPGAGEVADGAIGVPGDIGESFQRVAGDGEAEEFGFVAQALGEIGLGEGHFGESDAFVSQWENFPREIAVPLKGKSARVYLLMAGSTNSMQSRIDKGEVIVTYADGTTARLPLRNPENWWPIDQDYLIDDFAFRRPGPLPPRVNLKTGEVRILEMAAFKGKGRKVEGGAATVLDLPLDPAKELKSLTVRALSNDIVIGLMSATLARQ